MKPCVFFDRDGIVNASPGPGYVERWEEFRLMDQFPAVLSLVIERGYEAVVVTNQRGVALGIMTEAELRRIHRNLQAQLRDRYGLQFLDIVFCPHENDTCRCRKPLPGMIVEAARRHALDLERSWMIGDGERDIQAGMAAGCRTVLVSQSQGATVADYRVKDLNELESFLRRVL